jgi:hypothetical protein
LFGLFKINIKLFSDAVLWFLVLNINNRIYPTLSGGEILLNQLLIFNVFILFTKENKNILNSYLIILHNIGVAAIITQVCFIYLFSGIAKLSDESWMNGTAIIETLSISHFSNSFLQSNLRSITWMLIIANYVVIAFQLLFPIGAFIKKSKKVFIVIGVTMHLFIIFTIGLVSFGFIMMLPYIYFWPNKNKD